MVINNTMFKNFLPKIAELPPRNASWTSFMKAVYAKVNSNFLLFLNVQFYIGGK